MSTLAVERNDARSRYEGRRDGVLVSLVDYVLRDDTMIVIHTGTEHRWRGNGFAAQVTQAALDDARRRGLHVVARCPFTADFIQQHPDYADLLNGNGARR
ncbi:MAG TPA: GNAT family N-acetyltransferase [Microlunatus sp.]|jgi:predicted GNAT family acetyltransferase|nr:GNAT family N-acetyltransferase [Microlunatus sp.]